jgi:hypothetical protein
MGLFPIAIDWTKKARTSAHSSGFLSDLLSHGACEI